MAVRLVPQWTLPDGTAVTIVRATDGYVLYTESEWRAYAPADWEADASWRLLYQGRATGHTVPREVLERAQ